MKQISALISALSNTKTRTLALLAGAVMIVGIIVAIVSSTKTGEPLEESQSKTSSIPKNIQSTPGAKTTERYRELQQEANLRGALEAEESGSTFVPTIVGEVKNERVKKQEDIQSEILKALEEATTPEKKEQFTQPNNDLALLLAQQQQDQDEENRLRQQSLLDSENERLLAAQEQRLQTVEQVAQAMDQQLQAAFSAWNETPKQQYTQGDYSSKQKLAEASLSESNSSKDAALPVVAKAGSIFFGVLETAINSDEPSPILAKIVQGPLKGAKLIGTIEVPDKGEKIVLKFNTINMPSEKSSNKISAVAIDPDSARTALASDVDNHYFLRWGSLFASAFLEGYSKAVGESGTTVNTTTAPGSTTTTTNKASLSGKEQLFEGLGRVGERWSEALGDNFNRKPTITIDSGVGVGILITSDLKLGEEPGEEKAEATTAQAVKPNAEANSSPFDVLSAITKNVAAQNAANTASQTTNVEK